MKADYKSVVSLLIQYLLSGNMRHDCFDFEFINCLTSMGSWGTEHKVLNAAVMLQVQQLATRRDEVKKGATTKKKQKQKTISKKRKCVWQILTVTNAFLKLGSSTRNKHK